MPLASCTGYRERGGRKGQREKEGRYIERGEKDGGGRKRKGGSEKREIKMDMSTYFNNLHKTSLESIQLCCSYINYKACLY